MAETWETISPETELHVGDIVELDFTLMSLFNWDYWMAVQLAAIESAIEADQRFTLLRHSYPENNVVTFRIRVDQNPIQVTVLIALITGVAGLGLIWLTFREARRLIVEGGVSPKEVIKEAGWSSLMIAAAIIAVLIMLKLIKR